jgi:hypothetical protein
MTDVVVKTSHGDGLATNVARARGPVGHDARKPILRAVPPRLRRLLRKTERGGWASTIAISA